MHVLLVIKVIFENKYEMIFIYLYTKEEKKRGTVVIVDREKYARRHNAQYKHL